MYSLIDSNNNNNNNNNSNNNNNNNNLLSLLQTGKSYRAIRSSVFAIRYFHKIVGYRDPCDNELVNYILEGIKKLCCHTPKKKKIFYSTTTLHIIQIIRRR